MDIVAARLHFFRMATDRRDEEELALEAAGVAVSSVSNRGQDSSLFLPAMSSSDRLLVRCSFPQCRNHTFSVFRETRHDEKTNVLEVKKVGWKRMP